VALLLAFGARLSAEAPPASPPAPAATMQEAVALLERAEPASRPAAVARVEALVSAARAAGDHHGEAVGLGALGSARHDAGDYQGALALHEQAVRAARLGEAPEVLRSALNRQGVLLDALGRREEAVQSYREALGLLPTGTDDAARAQVLSNLGSSLSSIGEKAAALEALEEGLALRRKGASRDVEAQALLQLGRVHRSLGDPERALGFHREALAVSRAAGLRKREADSLNNVGTALAAMGELDAALASYRDALSINRQLKDSHGEASALNNTGWAQDRKGESGLAVESFEKAVTLFRGLGARANEAQALTNLGRVVAAKGDPAGARVHLEAALALRRQVRDPRGEAETLYYLARAERDGGRLEDARARVEEALARVEDVRSATPGPRLRASYLASVQDYYALHADVLMLQHRERPRDGLAALALASSERARARSLLDLLAEAGADIRGDADPALVARERSLRRQLSARAERHGRLLAGQATAAEREQAARDVEDAVAELERLEERLRTASPRYADLAHPRPVGLADIQRDLLDDGTVLLEYALGEERSYLWAVTRDGLHAYELASRARVEAAARTLHERLQAPGPLADVGQAAAALGALVLAPAADRIAGRRIVVVADGALEYVPFEVLPDPGAPDGAPLVAGHDVVRAPSASALAALRRETAQRPRPPRDVAVLADPVFVATDARIRSGANASASAPAPAPPIPAVRSVGFADGRLPRLPGTRREAAAIMSLVPSDRGRQALDFEASRELATSEELGRHRIVHFATHGLLDSARPELSGIVLSLVDREGRPRDGFLRMHELYTLKLPVDLVVLSACRTALGREVRGEGLVGLTRGFMYAGAPRVVASLWTVDDKATAELMTHFYRGLLGPRPVGPAAALRAAQDAVRTQRRWRHPYYWAGFVLHGDWR
jgi:CHAT domain-containing protein/Tfp pilus assembly protein PilF